VTVVHIVSRIGDGEDLFIGIDNYAAGRTAAYYMTNMQKARCGSFVALCHSSAYQVHKQRINGFSDYLADHPNPAHTFALVMFGMDERERSAALFSATTSKRPRMPRLTSAAELANFDVAVMALVIFFVPDPAKGVAEMARVVRPGGEVAAYVWDIIGGKGAAAPIESETRAMDLTPPRPPSFEASRIEAVRELWSDAGLDAIETREIVVQRTFNDFDDFWTTTLLIPTLGPTFAVMPPKDAKLLKTRVRARLPTDAAGRITYEARANAVKGRMPE